jgi:hypothetical protein
VVIRISVEGLTAVKDHLEDMRRRAEDVSPAWEEFLEWWVTTNVEQFSSRGARWRTPWKPLAPRTVAEKRRQGYLSEPLVRTTRLRNAMTRRPLEVERVTATDVEAGTDLYYAKYHQSGTRYMPARKLINADAVAREGAAGAAVLSWIVEGVPNTGGVRRLER